jgi:hypothetical protein
VIERVINSYLRVSSSPPYVVIGDEVFELDEHGEIMEVKSGGKNTG